MRYGTPPQYWRSEPRDARGVFANAAIGQWLQPRFWRNSGPSAPDQMKPRWQALSLKRELRTPPRTQFA